MIKNNREDFEFFALANGIRCIHRRQKTSPVAHIALTIGAGTRDEASEQHGVAHLVEHMMFKGTARRTAWQVNSLLENSGGELNAFTTKEETVIHASLLRSEFSKGIDLLADMAFNSSFNPKELIKEKEVILDEINSYKDSPSELIYDEFEELLFNGSGLGRNILGDRKSLRKIGPKETVDYVTRNYKTDRIVFSASSNMTHKRFRELCERYLKPLSNGEGAANGRTKPGRVDTPFTIVRKMNTYQGHCLMGGYAYDLHDSKRMHLALLINLLGGPASVSRLNQELREKRGWTYNVEGGYIPYSDSGLFSIYLGCDKDKIEPSQELVHKELKKLRETGLTDIQLARAKKLYLGQMAILNESPEALMLGAAKSLLVYNSLNSTAEIATKIESITTSDLLAAANETFTPENLNTLIYR